MVLKVTADVSPLQRSIERYAMATSLDFEYAALRLSRGMMRHVIGITPPGDGAQSSDRAALTMADKKRGEAMIDADLAVLFAGVKLKRKRDEQWPDLAGHHRAAFLAGKTPGKRMRPLGPLRFVDESKLRRLARDLKSRIGRLASGWLSGADAVKTNGIPAWVRRHGDSRGRHSLDSTLSRTSLVTTHRFLFIASNTVVHPSLEGEMERRLTTALFYARKSLDRETNAILAKRGQEFGRAA